MPIPVRCGKCGKAFNAPDSMAGKAAQCPCGAALRVPAPQTRQAPMTSPLISLLDEEAELERKKQIAEERKEIERQFAATNPYAPPAALGGSAGPTTPKRPRQEGEFASCPACGEFAAKKMVWTWWGGLIGGLFVCHVKCQNCKATYNGKTGKYNTTFIVIWLLAPFVITVFTVIIGAIVMFFLGGS